MLRSPGSVSTRHRSKTPGSGQTVQVGSLADLDGSADTHTDLNYPLPIPEPSKVDRSAAYATRHVAKNIVAAKLARRCTGRTAYAIGVMEPVPLFVDTHGTGVVRDTVIEEAVREVFALSPAVIIDSSNQ